MNKPRSVTSDQFPGNFGRNRRFYMPGLTRWMTSVRTFQYSGDENAYSYAFNNPVKWVDPNGEYPGRSNRLLSGGDWNKPACDSVAAVALASLASCFDPNRPLLLPQ